MASLFLVVGLTILATLLSRRWLESSPIPPLVMYIVIGLLLNALNVKFHFMHQSTHEGLHLMGEIGIVLLLFRVGLEANLEKLLAQLKHASIIWLGNLTISAIAGYLTARYILDLGLLASLFVGVALSATSVGISAALWQTHNKIDTPEGALLIDVAELDDISAIILMSLLFSLIPRLQTSQAIAIKPLLIQAGLLIFKLALFVLACVLFARYLERPLLRFFQARSFSSVFVGVIGIAFVISGLAGWLGYSLAIGAIFAGFSLSRDPLGKQIDDELEFLFHIFVPFFFVNIGFNVKFEFLGQAVYVGGMLFVAACLGKLIGTGIPARMILDRNKTMLLSVSMIPRAEIAMLVILFGYQHKPSLISPRLFGGMVIVTVLSCILTPLLLNRMFRTWDEADEAAKATTATTR